MTRAWQEALSSYASWLWKHPWVAYESKFYLLLWSIQPQRQGTDTELTYPTPTLLSLETTKLPEDTPELWKTVGGVQLMPLPQVEQWRTRAQTELQCRKCTLHSHTSLPHCRHSSSKPSSDTCKKQTPPKAFAFRISSLQKMNTLQAAKQSLVLPRRKAYAIFNAIYIHVHITINVMMETESSNILYPHY